MTLLDFKIFIYRIKNIMKKLKKESDRKIRFNR